jgi:hypothetical protein
MKRTLLLLLSVAAVVAGCGSSAGTGSTSSSSSNETAAGVLAAAQSATADATSAGFDAKVDLTLSGNLASAGPSAALLQGPLNLELKGHAGKGSNGKPKFDVNFALNYQGGSFSGQALSPDGKVLYLQMPALMGPGWHSTPLSGLSSAAGGSSSSGSGLAQLKAAGVDPSKWLKNLDLSSSGGQDTISADLDLPAVFADIAKAGAAGLNAQATQQMAQLEKAVKTAHGSLSFDSSTHLPTDEQFQLAMDVPPAMASQAGGLKGFSLSVDVKFSDWNKDFSVTKPSGATPLNTGGLLGGLSAA